MNKTILYIEDNYNNARLVQRLLKKYPYTILIVSGAIEGLDILADTKIDLILLDINLPGIDGLAFMQYLKEDAAYCDIPTVAVTANSMHGDREYYLEAGFDAYVAKPVMRVELYHTIARLLAGGAQDAEQM